MSELGRNGKPHKARWGRMPDAPFSARVNLRKLAALLGREPGPRDARDDRLRPLDVAVFAALVVCTGPDGRCHPSRHTLGMMVNAAERHVGKALARLWAAGLVTWERRSRDTTDPTHRVNGYTLPHVAEAWKQTGPGDLVWRSDRTPGPGPRDPSNRTRATAGNEGETR